MKKLSRNWSRLLMSLALLLIGGVSAVAFDTVFFDNVRLNSVLFQNGNGSKTVTMIAPSALAANYQITLPPDDGNSGQFLRTDGNGVTTWVTPAGGGSVTNFSFTNANGVNGVVTNPTTTPNLTVSLTAITPTTVTASGNISTTGGNLSVNGTFNFSGSQNFNSFSGNGLKVVTGTGSYVSGHGTVIDANGNVVDSGAPGGGGVTNLTGTVNEITASAATGAVNLSIPNAFVLPGTATVSGGGVYKGTTGFSVADSIGAGAGGVNPFPVLIGTDLTWTVDNTNSVAGRGTSEQQGVVDVATVTTGTNTFYEIGINDMDAYWINAGNTTNATLAAVYKQAAMYETAIMAIPNANRYAANNVNIAYTGVWTGFPGHSPAQQSSLGTATWTTPGGRAIYIGTDLVVGNLGTFTLTVDGVSTGVTYNCFSSQNITSTQGSTYVPQLIRIDNVVGVPLTDVPHTVVLTITSPNDASHLVYLTWAGWSIGQRNVIGPNVFVWGITKKTSAGYVTFGSNDANTATYNQNIRDNVQLLANDGLNITFVDDSNINPATMLQADGLHPNQTGQNQMAINGEEEITGAGSVRIKGSPIDGDLPRQFFGATVQYSPTTKVFWGAATVAFPMMKRSTTFVAFRLADDSADSGITALQLKFPTAGSAGAPNLLWNTNDGLFSLSAGSIDFAISGSRTVSIQAGVVFINSNTGHFLFGTGFDAALWRDAAAQLSVSNSNSTSCTAAVASCGDFIFRHILGSGTSCTIGSGFGAGAAFVDGGCKDTSFRLGVGTTPGTTGVVTFGTAFVNKPSCHATDESTNTAIQAVATTTNVTLNGVFVNSDVVSVVCIGRP